MPVTLGSKTLQMAIPEAPVSKSWNRYGENIFFLQYRPTATTMIIIVINHADDVLRRRGYSDHFDTMCVSVYVCLWVCSHDKTKTPD